MNNSKELIKRLRPLIHSPGVGDMCKLLEVFIEEWKESLTNVTGDEVLKLQGAIKKNRELLLDLNRPTFKAGFKDGAYEGEGKK